MKKSLKFSTLAFGLLITLGLGVSLVNNTINTNDVETNQVKINNVEPLYAAFTLAHAGTLTDPYSVSDVIGLGNSISKDKNRNKFEYVKGIVSEKPNIDTRFNNAQFKIKDEANDNTVKTYRVSDINGADFTESSCKVGDIVVIKGCIGKHGKTLQVAHLDKKNAELISVTTPSYPLNSITLVSSVKSLFVGKTTQLSVEYDSPLVGAEQKAVEYTSSDPTLATVDQNGLVKALKICDKVTITATSKVKPELTSSIDLKIEEVSYEGTYNWTFNSKSDAKWNTPLTDGNSYINGYVDGVVSFTANKFYANNGPHNDSFVLGEKNGAGSLTLKVQDPDTVITSIQLIGSKISGNDSANTITSSGISYKVDATSTSGSDTTLFYPCANQVEITTNRRVFFDKIIITTVKKTNVSKLEETYYDAFLKLTNDACGVKNVTKEVWTRCKTAFTNLTKLSSEAANNVKNADIDKEAILRYKGIIEKYGTGICEDYLAKGYEALTRNTILNIEDNQMIIAIICISIVSVTAIVLLVSLKRKKQAK